MSSGVTFPLLCESCLGENPYLKMQRTPGAGTCKMCAKGFELFRWRPGRAQHLNDKICQICARMKNICQTCILDLRFGLPSQLRDSVMTFVESKDKSCARVHESDVTRDYKIQEYLRDSSSLSYSEESSDKMVEALRAVKGNRDTHKLQYLSSSNVQSSASNKPSSSGESAGDASVGADSFCVAECGPALLPTSLSVEDTGLEKKKRGGSKRKSSVADLPPRPPGPPPAWAMKNDKVKSPKVECSDDSTPDQLTEGRGN